MPSKNWLTLPEITAPSPSDPDAVWRCRISPVFVERSAFIARKTPIFQLWTHVVGELPPINLIGTLRPVPTITTLHDAYACFQGVNRPYVDEVDGKSVFVYVLGPKISIAYNPSLACVAKAVVVPAETVLTVQVRPTSSLQKSQEGIHGIVTRLEFVTSVGDSPTLPVDHDSRYNKRLWMR